MAAGVGGALGVLIFQRVRETLRVMAELDRAQFELRCLGSALSSFTEGKQP